LPDELNQQEFRANRRRWLQRAERQFAPRHKEVGPPERIGQMGHYATRILLQNGFKARNVAGGMLSRSHAVSS